MMPGGRPLKFDSVEKLENAIDKYFADCDPHPEQVAGIRNTHDDKGKITGQEEYLYTRISNQKPYTITGLAVALDTSRETLLDYQEREEFSDTIKKAKARIHAFAENRLFENNPTGVIFNLKNNFGWKDRTETELSGGGDPIRVLLDKFGITKEVQDDRKGDESVQSSSEGSS
jgi:hypothetical protein